MRLFYNQNYSFFCTMYRNMAVTEPAYMRIAPNMIIPNGWMSEGNPELV